MKRILTTLCALAIVVAGSVPALAVDTDANPGQSASYYPISVEEYTYGSLDEPRIEKVYQLSLSDDPSGIPTEDFVRGGRLYYLLDMTRKNEVGVDTKLHTESVTKPSDTNDLEKILQQLDAELEVTTEDGYTGTLQLDHTTVKVAVDGYDTKTQALSASRSYPNLSEADVSLIPKSIEDNGKTLTLADVQWASTEQTDGAGGIVTRYTATASYTGSSSYQYATGYTVTADYTGEVAKPNCDVVTYTAIFGSTEAPEESTAPGTEQETGSESAKSTMDLSVVKIPLLVGGVAIALAAGGVFAYPGRHPGAGRSPVFPEVPTAQCQRGGLPGQPSILVERGAARPGGIPRSAKESGTCRLGGGLHHHALRAHQYPERTAPGVI